MRRLRRELIKSVLRTNYIEQWGDCMSNENKTANESKTTNETTVRMTNFIHSIVEEDGKSGKYGNKVYTRFPPEPNGYLHIGHAKSICLNFGTAKKYGGKCNLRFDDTNPVKEDTEYVDSIMEDVRWLGFEWDELFYASDYFEQLYQFAVELIQKEKAYICQLSPDEIRDYRGTFDKTGKESPYRNRPVAESLDLFARMRAGEFKEGEMVLRAKIDMASPNMNMRDPVLYRIAHAHHHRTGDAWCIYPMYDYAHPISDAIEGITHSICTLEFEAHRPLYDWCLAQLDEFPTPPQQIEFARLEMTNTLMSKRYLKKLVDDAVVDGWDDPRMPTICGLRRRGYTPEAIRDFAERIGVSKSNSIVDVSLLEHCIREDLKLKTDRYMAVLKPLKVVITNYPEGQVEWLDAENNKENPERGKHKVPFSRELYIEADDFMETPPPKYFRLFQGNEVRLANAYFVKCEEVVKDPATGEVIELRCTYDPETKSGSGFTGRKVKGTIHWVSAAENVKATVRLYDYLMVRENSEDASSEYVMNPASEVVLKDCVLEKAFEAAEPGEKFQFFRHGYFSVDTRLSGKDHKVFNQVVQMKDNFNKK